MEELRMTPVYQVFIMVLVQGATRSGFHQANDFFQDFLQFLDFFQDISNFRILLKITSSQEGLP